MEQNIRKNLVDELSSLLEKGKAHVSFEEAVADISLPVLNQHVPEVPYTIWQLAEHLRIAQWDIIEFCLDPAHQSPAWPDAYWPDRQARVDAAGWQATLTQLRADRARFIALLHDPAQDLLAPFPHGTGQTLLREALVLADHNAYHTGEIVLVRRLLKTWE